MPTSRPTLVLAALALSAALSACASSSPGSDAATTDIPDDEAATAVAETSPPPPPPAPWGDPAYEPPRELTTTRVVLEPLAPEHAELDFAAAMGSREHLLATLQWGTWPREDFTAAENRVDLERHLKEFDDREGYAFTVMTPDRERCVGCVYLEPAEAGPLHASMAYWVVEDELANDLDEYLVAQVLGWIERDWPFVEVDLYVHEQNGRGAEVARALGMAPVDERAPEDGEDGGVGGPYVWRRASGYTLEQIDDAKFDGEHAQALAMLEAMARSSDKGAGQAAFEAARMYARGRGMRRDPVRAADRYQLAFDRMMAEIQALNAGRPPEEAPPPRVSTLDETAVAIASAFLTGDGVEQDFPRGVDLLLRALREVPSARAVDQLAIAYAEATPTDALYVPGRHELVNYLGSLALTVLAETDDPVARSLYLNALGQMRRGGPDRADEEDPDQARTQPFPVHYDEAYWAYERAAEEHASGTAMYSLGIMHVRAMGRTGYWIDGADSEAVRFGKNRRRLETAREWFRRGIAAGDPENETWFVGLGDQLVTLAEEHLGHERLDKAARQILKAVADDPGLLETSMAPETWVQVQALRERAARALDLRGELEP